MSGHACSGPEPVEKRLFTPGVFVLLFFMAVALAIALYRFIFGLGSVTNLTNQNPWGIWIAIDVATGIALAAGGFCAAALALIFHRGHYRAIVRPALLTALLGYTCEVVGLMADLGRPYSIWHPIWPTMWSDHSVMFTVALCVTFYLAVLYIEFMPIVLERFIGNVRLPGRLSDLNDFVDYLLRRAHRLAGFLLPVLIVVGVVISLYHQQALGALMVMAPYKLHPLWYSPWLPLLFLLSAMAVGFPMVIFESMLAARCFKHRIEMEILTPLSRYVVVLLGLYMVVRIADLVARGAHEYIFEGSFASTMFIIEMVGGCCVPWLMLAVGKVRRNPALLFVASTLIVLGVVLNRVNVFLVGYHPPYAEKPYFPALGEVLITVGLVCGLIFVYRLAVTLFPVLPGEGRREGSSPSSNSSAR